MSSRRDFLRFLVGTAACAATPVLFAGTPPNDKLDQVCCQIGLFVREHNLVPKHIVAINESGRLVIVAGASLALCVDTKNRVFHVADREGKYTRLAYRVEHRYLERADELSVFVHTESGCHTFPLAFTRPQEENREV
jgi:hypothetical protein